MYSEELCLPNVVKQQLPISGHNKTTRTARSETQTLSGGQKRPGNRKLVCGIGRTVCIRIDLYMLHFLEQAAPSQWQYSGVKQLCFVWWTEMVGHQNNKYSQGTKALK